MQNDGKRRGHKAGRGDNQLICVEDNLFLCAILRANMEICYLVKSFAGETCGFSYREDQVVLLRDC